MTKSASSKSFIKFSNTPSDRFCAESLNLRELKVRIENN